MIGPKSYIPILKWKRAEQRALKSLEDKDKKNIVPLIELVMPKPSSFYKDRERKVRKTPEEVFAEVVSKFKKERIKEIPNEIYESWGEKAAFVDCSLLYEAQFTTRLKVESLNKIISAGVELGLKLIPVVNLNDEPPIRETVGALSKKYDTGLCLRVTISDFDDIEKLNNKLENFLKIIDLSRENVDLLIDLKSIAAGDSEYARIVNLSQKLKDPMEWRSFILASGAFPEDLSACKFDEATFIPRLDWKNWFKCNHESKPKRIATFADYAIRNPIFKESNQFYPPTSSIRYTLENDWMVMKGKRLEHKYYLANAKLLVGSKEYFYGKDFSAGDRFTAEKAEHFEKYIRNPELKGTGSSEDWIFAGINHHLVLTAHQVANLS